MRQSGQKANYPVRVDVVHRKIEIFQSHLRMCDEVELFLVISF